jgi:transposase
MKLNAKEIIKLLIQKEDLTQKALVKILTQKTGKKYTPDGFSRKINRGTISYNEVVMIADILGYDISFERREN